MFAVHHVYKLCLVVKRIPELFVYGDRCSDDEHYARKRSLIFNHFVLVTEANLDYDARAVPCRHPAPTSLSTIVIHTQTPSLFSMSPSQTDQHKNNSSDKLVTSSSVYNAKIGFSVP
jgi:hypothetical protein